MVKYIFVLLILCSCINNNSNNDVIISLKEIYIEYNVLNYDEFFKTENIYRPTDISLILCIRSKTDTLLKFHPNKYDNDKQHSFYWISTDGDSIKMKSFQKNLKLKGDRKKEISIMVHFKEMEGLKNAMRIRNLDSIANNIKNFNLVYYSNELRDFEHITKDSTSTIFIFADTTIIYSQALQHVPSGL